MGHKDLDISKFGWHPSDVEKFKGRCIDLLGRSLKIERSADPVKAIESYLANSTTQTPRNEKEALNEKPIIKIKVISSMATFILHICISMVSLCFYLSITSLPLEAKENHPDSQSAAAGNMSQVPSYSLLYERLLLLEREEKLIEALRIIPELYAAEIPVDSFYLTLENKRQQLLEAVSRKEISFPVGREEYRCAGIQQLFMDLYLKKPETYRQIAEPSADIDLDRFIYLMIIKGQDLKDSGSRFNMQSTLTEADPWLVSGALFLDRKQKTHTITPQGVIDRWQSRPDLWDEECTRQALLFLAQFDSTAIKTLEITNEDIRMELENLHSRGRKGDSTLSERERRERTAGHP